MARLLIRSDGFHNQVIELKLGVNRVGRSPANDFQIEHPTISARHCEILLKDGELDLRDCDSTNGTFVGGEPIDQASLKTGGSFQLGDVEILVEHSEINIAIPNFDVPRPSPP